MELALVLILLLTLILLGSQLFLVIGAMSLVLFYFYIDIPMFDVIKTMFDTVNKSALLSIPLYVFAGAVMSRGEIAKRLIDLALATFGWMKGGLAVAAVLACIFFAAISGSSPVTLIAIGTIMYPAMIKNNYPEKIPLGVLTVSGSLGILIPPSIPMIIYSIVVSGPGIYVDVNKLFIAGIIPGIVTGVLLMSLAVFQGVKYNLPTQAFSFKKFLVSLKRGIPAILMPVLILGGIYTGTYTVTEAAAVGAIYAILVELLFFREMKLKDIVETLYESVIILGIIFMIIAMATVFNRFLTFQEVPMLLLDWLQGFVTSKTVFLLMTIVLLLMVGLFMDSISAILIIAPLLMLPAVSYDVDLIHLGIVFIIALEIGYLTPPIGINLFVSSGLFNKPFTQVIKASAPYAFCLLIALLLVTFIPEITLFLTEFVE